MGGGSFRWGRASCGAVVFSFLALLGCASKGDLLDLAVNERLYRAPRYQARVPTDRAAVLQKIEDRRDARVADASAPAWPRRPMPEELWARSIPEMLDDTLRESLSTSGVVARLVDVMPPPPEALVIQPILIDARGYLEEQAAGRCTMATFSLRVVVSSPAAQDGTRTTLLDQTYEQSAGTQVTRSPTPIPELMGRCLYDATRRLLTDLDRGNVARSVVPQSPK